MRISLFLLLYGVEILIANGQNPEAQFSIQAAGCLGEKILIQNQSQGLRFEWDFCQGDLNLDPVGASAGIVQGSNIPTGVDVVYDGAEWYAFITSRNNNSIIRLSLGAEVGAVSSIVNLGNISSSLSFPTDIKIVSDNGKWYGFVFNESANVITRLDFGTSLTNTPTATILLTAVTSTSNQGLDVIRDGTQWYVVYTFNSQIGVVRLSTIESTPTGEDQILTDAISGNPSLGDIKLIEDNGSFFAYSCSWSVPKLYTFSFGSNIFSTPIESNISLPGAHAYYGVDGGYDAGFHLILSTLQGAIVRVDLNEDLSQVPIGVQDLGNSGIVFNTVKNRLIKHKSDWFNFSVDYINGTLFKTSFPTPTCQITPGLFTDENLQVEFSSSGTKYVTLRSFNEGAFDEQHKSITISSLNAPTLDFSNQQICVQNPIQFAYASDQSITGQSWNFGDGQTSSATATENVYSSAGSYEVTLNVSSSNGCTNTASKSIKVYNQPSSTFALPLGLICTNNEFTFINNTVDNFDGNLTYQWFVDNNLEATSRDLKYSFLNGGNQDIRLKTSIPGCSSELTQTLSTIQSGPTVDFDYMGQCENELITFTNNSAGDISGYMWDFGNGQTSTEVNETQNYSHGNYIVSLQTTGTNGCISTTNRSLTIYSAPQTDFLLELPPFSCAGTPSQFNDLTPGPVDSNLSAWSWNFGDTETATVKNPSHTYSLAGAYDVLLSTTTNFGCTATKIKTVQIAESPKPDFTLGASCLGKPTLFTDASGDNNKSWLWKIGGTSYAIQNPTHVFSTPGNFTTELMVTGNNECISIISKPVVVHVPPTLDFSTENNCATQFTLFNDITTPTEDPPVSHQWDFTNTSHGTGSSTQYTFSSPGTYNVKLTTTNQSGCSYSLTKSTIIVAAPIADFSFSDESGPPPLAVQFTNASQHATSYHWRFNDPNNSDSFLESPSVTYTTLGDFRVDLTASNVQGCVDTKSEVIHVIIPSTEVELEQFTLLHDQVTGSVRPVLSIKNNSNYTISNIDVVLDIGGNTLVKEEINITVLPNASSSHILKYELLPGNSKLEYLCVELQLTESRLSDEEDLTNNNACVSLESDEILLPPYPNPVQDRLHFDWIASVGGSAKVSIVSQTGQLAYQMDVTGVEVGLNQIVLDVSKLNSGFYMLVFEGAGVRKTFSFVILN